MPSQPFWEQVMAWSWFKNPSCVVFLHVIVVRSFLIKPYRLFIVTKWILPLYRNIIDMKNRKMVNRICHHVIESSLTKILPRGSLETKWKIIYQKQPPNTADMIHEAHGTLKKSKMSSDSFFGGPITILVRSISSSLATTFSCSFNSDYSPSCFSWSLSSSIGFCLVGMRSATFLPKRS